MKDVHSFAVECMSFQAFGENSLAMNLNADYVLDYVYIYKCLCISCYIYSGINDVPKSI